MITNGLREVFPVYHLAMWSRCKAICCHRTIPVRLIGPTRLYREHGGVCLVGFPAGRGSFETEAPTVIFMHHPPFASGTVTWTKRSLPEERSSLPYRQAPQVERIACGHRAISRRFAERRRYVRVSACNWSWTFGKRLHPHSFGAATLMLHFFTELGRENAAHPCQHHWTIPSIWRSASIFDVVSPG
jgi:hypothetical protein